MSSKIRFAEDIEPDTPPDDRVWLWYDSTDHIFKYKLDDGSVHNLIVPGQTFFAEAAYTITPTDISNKYITLTYSPTVPAQVSFLMQNNPVKLFSVDFTVSGNQVQWTGLGLDGLILAGDVVVVQYWM